MSPHVLVIGCGSVGKRHAANLHALGCTISGVDPRADRLAELADRVPVTHTFVSTEAAVDRLGGVDAVVVASPPSLHVAQALPWIDRGVPVLLEKPVSPDLVSARTLRDAERRTGTPVMLGYSFRWWPPVQHLGALVARGEAGRVLRVSMVLAAHLADWHPWERYQDFFMADARLGGGALLDESHFLDLLVWMFGWPLDLMATIDRLSALEITTDDNVEINLRMRSGARAVLHLDLYSRPHQREITVCGDAGTIHWDNERNVVELHRAGAACEPTAFNCERNEMFVAESRSFLEVIGGAPPPCTLLDGLRVLQLVEAVRASAAEGRLVAVPDPESY